MARDPAAGTNLRSRLVVGALAGIVGTVAMTAAMRRLHARLPAQERYPLPPREITERMLPDHGEAATEDLSLLTHVGFGAAAGAAMVAGNSTGPVRGSLFGLAVWLGSYFGWVPASGILRAAGTHPPRRNALMIAVHLVWGAVTALSARELLAARRSMLAEGPLRDAPDDG